MKISALIPVLIAVCLTLQGQVTDTSEYAMHLDIQQVVISATRTPAAFIRTPGQAEVIQREGLETIPLVNVDDALKTLSNINVNRSWGIFSKNSSVTMRGLPGSARTLILVDGVPKNKIAGGSVNWHNIHPDVIEKIEVIKGPTSALYGNNAMGGVINMITRKPEESFTGSAEVFGGSYGTFGGNALLSGHTMKEGDRGFYYSLNGNYRQGEGYIFEPLEYIDNTDVGTYLREYGGGTKIGYQFGKGHNLELAAGYYDELRGGGNRVFEEDGTYDAYLTRDIRLNYSVPAGKNSIQARLNFMNEDYSNQKESLNSSQEYSLSHAGTLKNDIGILFSITSPISRKHLLTSGMEARAGNVSGQELYRTTTDDINYSGSLGFIGLYIQDEYTLPVEKFKVIAGIRADVASFRNAHQEVINPSSKTGFPESFHETFASSGWSAISPKLSLQYNISPEKTTYILTGAGFNPPNIDDLVKSGKIRKGFRLANPTLQPEKILNFEVGFKGRIFDELYMSTALYHSPGRDFHYLVATGDTLDTGGSSLKPVYRRENISRVSVTGFELNLVYSFTRQLSLQSGYSYNHSLIREYAGSETLEGNFLAEVPPHLLHAGITWQNRLFTVLLNCNYTDSQYADDENMVLLEDHFLVNMKLQTTILNHLNIYFTCQNIFDVEFIDRKNKLSPGRYIMTGLRYKF